MASLQDLTYLRESPSQTAGPYVHIGCVPTFAGVKGVFPQDLGNTMLSDGTKGERITIEGQIIDGSGAALRDAVVEIWQADAEGRYNSPVDRRGADTSFTGWGRQPTDNETGIYRFETIKPGRVPWPDGRMQAPHILVWIVARGINIGLHTRIYFADEEAANAEDPVLGRINQRHRIPTLIAPRDGGTYTFTVNLQGDDETVFFDV